MKVSSFLVKLAIDIKGIIIMYVYSLLLKALYLEKYIKLCILYSSNCETDSVVMILDMTLGKGKILGFKVKFSANMTYSRRNFCHELYITQQKLVPQTIPSKVTREK